MQLHRGQLRYLGFSLYWVWTLLCFQSTVAFLPSANQLDTILAAHSAFFTCSLVINVVFHPICGIALAKWPWLFTHSPAVGAMLISASMLPLNLLASGSVGPLLCLGFCAGMGSALLDVSWAQVLGSLKPNVSGRVTCASIALAAVEYIAVAALGRLSPWLCLVILVCLPIGSAVALTHCRKAGEGSFENSQLEHARRDARQIASSLKWPVAGGLMFYFVYGCVESILYGRLDFNSVHTITFIFTFIALALVYLALLKRRRIEVSRVYVLVMALVSAGFLILPFVINSGTDTGLFAASVLINVGVTIVDAVIYCFALHAAYDWRTSGALVGGIVRGVTVGMSSIGHIAGGWLAQSTWSDGVDFVVFATAITYLLILSSSLFLSHMRSSRADDALMVSGPDEATDTTTRSIPKDSRGVVQTTETSSVSDTPLPDSAATADAIAASPMDQHIEQIALEHHLSRRETEVFGYIARGRSVPFIAEALVLSENTVRSHSRRIYEKLDVHSKQQLLDLVERGADQQDGQETD